MGMIAGWRQWRHGLGLAVLAVAATASTHGPRANETGVATPWVEIANNARVRLVAGPAAGGKTGTYLAGVEIVMGPGWKTYWRMPGDAGVPPAFDWSQSSNLGQAETLYPAPTRLPDPAALTIGYMTSVVFPVQVAPHDPGKPVALKLTLDFGLCKDICIPAAASLSLVVPTQLSGAPGPQLAAALERVPRTQAARRPSDPKLTRVTAHLDGPAARLLVEAAFPGGTRGADLFIEAQDGTYVPQATPLPQTTPDVLRFEADLSRIGDAKDLKGKTLWLTLVSEKGSSEEAWQAK
jgi:DsbC/DsbD-like thiol-disulfide interchange protein